MHCSKFMAAIHLIISGRVQGVSYRRWTVNAAQKLGLTGWVRNRSDGTVEALFCGEDAAVAQMRLQCERGPTLAKVEHIIESEWQGETPTDFVQLPTE